MGSRRQGGRRRSWFGRRNQKRRDFNRQLLLDTLERRDLMIATPAYFDIGALQINSQNMVETNYTGVNAGATYAASPGYGWTASGSLAVNSTAGSSSDGYVRRDYVKGTAERTFRADVANGDYDVTVMVGAGGSAQDDIQIKIAGSVVDSDIDTAAGIFYTRTFRTTVSNGQLLVGFNDTDSTDAWYANGIIIEAAQTIPSALTSLSLDFGTPTSPLSSGYDRASRFTMYSAMQRYGWLELAPDAEVNASGTDLQRDYVQGNRAHTFVADVVNGTYNVTLTMGAASDSQTTVAVSAEGNSLGSVTTTAGNYWTTTQQVTVSDGQFTLDINDTKWFLNELKLVLVTDAVNDTQSIGEDQLLTVGGSGVLANDLGSGLSVTSSSTTSQQGAAVSVNADGSFSYDPRSIAALQALPSGQQQSDTFTYTASGAGGNDTATVTVTVTGANDAPTVGSPVTSSAYASDNNYSVNLLTGASDVDTSSTLSAANVQLVSGNNAGITINGNSLEISPAAYHQLLAGQSAVATYSYNVTDGTASVAQTATVTIYGVNYAPTVQRSIVKAIGQLHTDITVALLHGAGDTNSGDTLSVTNLQLTSGNAVGITLVGNSLEIDTSDYAYLASGASEVVQYSYQVSDNHGATVSQTATITIYGGLADEFFDEGQAGFGSSGTWTSVSGGFSGNQFVSTANSSASASWTISNLAPGTYDVFATWNAEASAATSSSFTMLENGISQSVMSVDQRSAPTGATVAGKPWQALGTYSVNGTLAVRLDVNSGITTADAIRIVPHTPVTTDIRAKRLFGDGTNTLFTYDIYNTASDPFDVKVYRSADGITLDSLLVTHSVSASSDLATGTNKTIAIPMAFTDVQADYFLVAVVDQANSIAEALEANNRVTMDQGVFRTSDGIVHVHGTSGSDTISMSQDTTFVVWLNSVSFSYALATVNGVHVRSHASGDTVFSANESVWLFGGPGNDNLIGGADEDYLDGGADADFLRGYGDDDVLIGGAGGTLAYGGYGGGYGDLMYGGDGDDTLWGDDGPANTGAGEGDLLFGEAGHDTLHGQAGRDSLFGGDGEDTLDGGADIDRYDPHHGFDDVELIDAGQPNSALSGYWNFETVGFNGDQYWVSGTGHYGTWTFNDLPAGDYDVYATWAPDSSGTDSAPYTISHNGTTLAAVNVDQRAMPPYPIVSDGAWYPLGTYAVSSGPLVVRLDSVASGRVYDDTIRVVPHVAPGSGTDLRMKGVTTNGQNLYVTYDVLHAATTAFDLGVYRSSDGVTPETLVTTQRITASELLAMGLNHTVSVPVAFADVQEDYYLVVKLDIAPEITEQKEDNNVALVQGVFRTPDGVVHVQGGQRGDAVYVSQSSTITVTFNNTNYFYTPADVSSIHIRSHANNDSFSSSALTKSVWLFGGDGEDNAYGGAGDDYFDGGRDADNLHGGDGADTLVGGYGMGALAYGSYGGTDQLWGDNGDDWLYGDSPDGDDELGEADTIYGYGGNDVVYAGGGNDTVYLGDGNDKAFGGHGWDIMYGDEGNDELIGGVGGGQPQYEYWYGYGGYGYGSTVGDQLYGYGGNDKLYGDFGPEGGEGGDNDNLHGGSGADELIGGEGHDYYDPYGGYDNPELIDVYQSGFTNGTSLYNHPSLGINRNQHYSLPGSGGYGEWVFNDLPADDYYVSATWFADLAATTSATFTVREGQTVLGTFTVNQRNQPTELDIADRPWHTFGVFSITSGPLVVRLETATSGITLFDAVLVSSNIAPDAVNDAFTVSEDGPAATGNLLDNDDDPESLPLTIARINGLAASVGQTITLASGAHLLVTSAGAYSYTPAPATHVLLAGQTASDTFTYTIEDSEGAEDTAAVNITITGANDAPVIDFAPIIVNEDAAVLYIPLAGHYNDADHPSGPFEFDIESDDVSLVMATLVDLPNDNPDTGLNLRLEFLANQHGSAQITIFATDPLDAIGSDTFAVNVSQVNDPPVALQSLDDVSALEDSAAWTIDVGLLVEDIDSSLVFEAEETIADLVDLSWQGTVVTITPRANQNGTSRLTVTASDGPTSASIDFDITLTPVEDVPAAVVPAPEALIMEDGASVTIDLRDAFFDPDVATNAQIITYSLVANTNTGLAEAAITGHDVEIDVIANMSGSGEVRVRAFDGTSSADAIIPFYVLPTNDAPTLANPLSDITTVHSSAPISLSLTNVFADSDPEDVLSYDLTSANPGLALPVLVNGTWRIELAAGQTGQATITITATDLAGASATDEIVVTSTGIPYVQGMQLQQDTGTSATDRITAISIVTGTVTDDFQGGSVRIEFDLQGDGEVDGFEVVTQSGGMFTYDPAEDDELVKRFTGTYSLRYRVIALDSAAAVYHTGTWQSFSMHLAPPTLVVRMSDGREYHPGSTLDWGNVALGSTSTIVLSLMNPGSDDLLIDEEEWSLPSGFSFTTALPETIPSAGQVNVEVQFSPTTEGNAQGTFALGTNSPILPLFEATVLGTSLTLFVGDIHLVLDAGHSDEDRITHDSRLAGTVEGEIVGSSIDVEFDIDDDGTVDATIATLASGAFDYDPRDTDPALALGVLPIRYRPMARDGGTITYEGTWQTFSFTLAASPSTGPVRVEDFGLVKDTGSSSTDLQTVNPSLRGIILGDFEGSVRVDFDHNDDGVTDGFASVTAAGDGFLYDPREHEANYATTIGSRTIEYRHVELDSLGTVVSTGEWSSFTFDLLPVTPQYQVSGITLLNDTGSSNSDKVTTDPTLQGGSTGGAYSSVQFDVNGDLVVDDARLTNENGQFVYRPANVPDGVVTIRARSTEWNHDAGVVVAGSWVTFTFTLAPNPAPAVISLALVTDDGSSASDLQSSVPDVKGALQGDPIRTAGIRVEFDHNNDQVADGSAWTDGSGAFRYLPSGIGSGAVTINARAVVAGASGNVVGEWEDFSFTYLGAIAPAVQMVRLLNDTGSSTSDFITTDPSLLGKVNDGQNSLSYTIEIDHNNDDVVDGTSFADGTGVFEYRPSGLAAGSHTLRVRTRVEDSITSAAAVSSWSPITFTLETIPNAPPSVADLALVHDTGASPTDFVTALTTLRGRLVNDGPTAYLTVQMDDADADLDPDGSVIADVNGQFEYTPTLAPGQTTLRFRGREFNADTNAFVYGSWQEFTLTYLPAVNAVAEIQSIALGSDSGSSQTDGTTANPLVVGQVANDGGLGGIRIEFDHDNNGSPDGATFTDASGAFAYLPVFAEHGAIPLRARIVEWNDGTAMQMVGAWTSLSFTYEVPTSTPALIVSFTLANDDGSSPTDSITSDPRLIGRVVNENALGGVTIEVDFNNDQTPDALSTTDDLGHFVIMPANLSLGAISASVRTREIDNATHQVVTGGWTTLGFTLVAPAAAQVTINELALLEDTGSSNTDQVTWNPSLTGIIEGTTKFEDVIVEFDHNGDNLIDGTASVGSNGRFTYLPADLAYGSRTLRARAKFYPEASSPIVGNWVGITFTFEPAPDEEFRVSQLGLYSDTGNSNSDRVSSNPTISGQLANVPGYFAAQLEIDENFDGIPETSFAASGSLFSYTPLAVQPGIVAIRVRATATDANFHPQFTGWRTVAYVYATNPDSEESQDLAGGLATFDEAIEDAETAYDDAVRAGMQTYDNDFRNARSSYQDSTATSRSDYSGAIAASNQTYNAAAATYNTSYLAAVANANAAFQAALAAYTGPTATFEFTDFRWPSERPNANALVIPDPSSQVVPPASPTYSGESFNVIGLPIYQQESTAAETTRKNTIDDAEEAYRDGLELDGNTYKTAQENAQTVLQGKITSAKSQYENAIKPQSGDVNLAAEREAHERRLKDIADEFAQEVQTRFNEFNAATAQWNNYAIRRGNQPYQLVQYSRDVYTENNARYNLQTSYILKVEAAERKRDEAIAASHHTLAVQEATYHKATNARRFDAEHAFNERVALAQKEFQHGLADAYATHQSSLANRTHTRGLAVAAAQDAYDRAIALAKLHAWQAVDFYAPTPFTAYQEELASHEELFVRQVSELRLARATAIEGAAKVHRTNDVASEATQMRDLAQAEYVKAVDRSAALKTYRIASNGSEFDRAKKNADLWKAEQLRFAELDEQLGVRTRVEAWAPANLADEVRGRDLGFRLAPLGVRQHDAYWTSDWDREIDLWLAHADTDYTRQMKHAEINSEIALAKNAAIKQYVYGYLAEERRHAGLEADARAVYETAIAGADETFKAETLIAALDLRKNRAGEVKTYDHSVADAYFTFDTGYAAKQYTFEVESAESQQTFENAVAQDYVQLVTSWDGALDTPWSQFQLDLAIAHKNSVQASNLTFVGYATAAAEATQEHSDAAAEKNRAYRKAVADLTKQAEIDRVAKHKEAVEDLAEAAKSAARHKANGVKSHDKALIQKSEIYRKELADSEKAKRDAKVGAETQYTYLAAEANRWWNDDLLTPWQYDALYDYRRNVWYGITPAYPEGEPNPQTVWLDLIQEHEFAADKDRDLAISRADRDFNKAVSTARELWTTETSTIKVAYAQAMKNTETAQANAIRDANVTLLGELATIDSSDETGIATLDKSFDADLRTLDDALASSLLTADLDVRTASTANASSQRTAQALARQNYIVALHTDHAADLEAIAESLEQSGSSTQIAIANFQWQMAEAALAHAMLVRTADGLYQAALTSASAAETTRINTAALTHHNTVSGANAVFDTATGNAGIDASKAAAIAEITAQLSRDSAAQALTAATAVADASHRYDLALAERDQVNAMAASERLWVHQHAESHYKFWQNPGYEAMAVRDAELAAAEDSFDARAEEISQQHSLDRAEAGHARATTLGTALLVHATALGDAGTTLATQLNAADTAYQASFKPAETARHTALRGANNTRRQSLESSDRLAKDATGGADLTYYASVRDSEQTLAISEATATADYFIANAQQRVDTLYVAFSGYPLSSFTYSERFPYAEALAQLDWLTGMKPAYVAYVTATAAAEANYNDALGLQAQNRALSELDAVAATAGALASPSDTRANDDLTSQQSYDDQLVTLANTRRTALYAADRTRLIAYAQSDGDLGVANAAAEVDYHTEVLALTNPTWQELQTLSAERSEAQATAAKTASTALADADKAWIVSASTAEATYSTAEAAKRETLDKAIVDHQETLSLALADRQYLDTLAASNALNSSDLAVLGEKSARELALADAWVDLIATGYSEQVGAVENYVTVLDIPWAHFVVAHSQATVDWWDEVEPEHISAAIDRNAAELTLQQSINSSRTTNDTSIAGAQKTRDKALASADATYQRGRLTDHKAFESTTVAANAQYQAAYASAQRDLVAARAHIEYERATGATTSELADLEQTAIETYNQAVSMARRSLGIAQADAKGDERVAGANRTVTLATTRLSVDTTYITNRTAGDVAFATSAANGEYTHAVASATIQLGLEATKADARVDIFDNLGTDYPQLADIGPWAILSAALSVADHDGLDDSAAAMLGVASEAADADRDLAISHAAAEALFAMATTVGPAAYELARAGAFALAANAGALADNALAALGLYSPEPPSAPTLEDLSDRADLTPAPVDDYFTSNDGAQEPYHALRIGMPPVFYFGDLWNPNPTQLSGSQLLEAVVYPIDPIQFDAAYIYQWERWVTGIVGTVWNGLQNLLSSLATPDESDSLPGDVDVESEQTAPTRDLSKVFKGTAPAKPQESVKHEEMQALIDAGYVIEVKRPAESPREFVDRATDENRSASPSDPWYVRLFDGRWMRESYHTAGNLLTYGSNERPARRAAVLRIKSDDGAWVNYIYNYVPEQTRSRQVLMASGHSSPAMTYTEYYREPERWELIGIRKSNDLYTPYELAEMYIWDPEDIGSLELSANLLELPLYFIPFVGTAIDYSKGEYVQGTVSLVADLALGAGAIAKGVQAAAKGAQAASRMNTALKTMRVAYTLEVAATVGQGALAIKSAAENNAFGAGANTALILFRLLGLRVMSNEINGMKSAVKGTPAATAGASAIDGRPIAPVDAGDALKVLQETCFVAGTPLLTPDGSKAIEQFQVGDPILSRSEHDLDAPLMVRYVERVFQLSAPIVELRVGGQLIRTTAEHPFYVFGHGWKRTSELVPGDQLVSHTRQTVCVESVRFTDENATVYNLRVSGDHTYFVGSADWGISVWAHNAYVARQLTDGSWEVFDDVTGSIARTGLKEDYARAAAMAFNNPNGITTVLTPSNSSWDKHGSRLFAALKRDFDVDIGFAQAADNAAELTAREYQALINAGRLHHVGAFEDVHRVFHVYKHPTKDIFVLFLPDGTLATIWTQGSQARSWRRVMDWMRNLP